jgi:hypothetical protein
VSFVKLAVLVKRCFTRIKTCLCQFIQCAAVESVDLYRQIYTVKHPQPLIAVNHNPFESNSTILDVRMCSGFIYDTLGLFNSVFSVHILVIVTFYFLIFIFDI